MTTAEVGVVPEMVGACAQSEGEQDVESAGEDVPIKGGHASSTSLMPGQVTERQTADIGQQVQSKYRPDIDGLRAFAVFAVIIFHLRSDVLPSGFTGVDIFFVISGYVVALSLEGRADEDHGMLPFLSAFYARRAKRLLPNAMLVACAAGFSLVATASEGDIRVGTALRVGCWAMVGNANNYLVVLASDYWQSQSTSTEDNMNPFIHFWSLSVEEQYYLVYPILVAVSRGSNARAGSLVVLLAIASFFVCYALQLSNRTYSFYLSIARFWELSVGAGLAIFVSSDSSEAFKKFLMRPRVSVVTQCIAATCLSKSVLAVGHDGGFPLWGALWPVIGTAFFITAGLNPKSTLNACFTAGALLHGGRISYSLYLWHTPVFVMAGTLFPNGSWKRTAAGSGLSCVIVVILAQATYTFIEVPLRSIKVTSYIVLCTAAASMACVVAYLWTLSLIFENTAETFLGWAFATTCVFWPICFTMAWHAKSRVFPGRYLCALAFALAFLGVLLAWDHRPEEGHAPAAVVEEVASPTRDSTSCHTCACFLSNASAMHRPPNAFSTATAGCGGKLLKPCFGRQTADTAVKKSLAVSATPENMADKKYMVDKMGGGHHQEPVVFLFGDSHASRQQGQISALLKRQVIKFGGSGRLFSGKLPGAAFEALDAVTKPGDAMVCLLKLTHGHTPENLRGIYEGLYTITQKKGMPLILFSSHHALKVPAGSCARQRTPTSCSRTVGDVLTRVGALDSIVEEFGRRPNVTVIHKNAQLCEKSVCDIYVPGTAQIAFMDANHLSDAAVDYLAPWVCDGFHRAGLI